MSARSWILSAAIAATCGVAGWSWHTAEAPAPGVVLARRPLPAAAQAPAAPSDATPPATDSAGPRRPADARFQLLRVVLPAAAARPEAAEALIAVDGLPPRAYRVGDAVVGAVVLQSLQGDRATLGAAGGPPAVVLEVGRAAPPATVPRDAPRTVDVSPAVDRSPVPVSDPDHGVDTSNH